MNNAQAIRNSLLQDYTEYLSDCTLRELKLISRNNVFTKQEAIKEEYKKQNER